METYQDLENKPIEVLILNTQSGDWQGMYINGTLIDEGHELGEGDNFYYLLEKAELFGFKRKDIRSAELNDVDDLLLSDVGNFPYNLNELEGKY